jgi:sterol desaturase/sphingolipid hydroxylase (fatty acid hydroxylase superfamily)
VSWRSCYTLSLWHILTHRLRLLWRCHRVHHADLDLTATTALRFHALELALSAPWRAAQVVLIGVGPAGLQLWQRLTLASILFHHANLRSIGLPGQCRREAPPLTALLTMPLAPVPTAPDQVQSG